MKTISILLFASSLTYGCAGTQIGQAVAPRRHAVLAYGTSVKAVVAGPSAIHAYSGFAGGSLFSAPIVSGTDSDCQAPPPRGERSELPADRVINFEVGAGYVACLATTTPRSFELLWRDRRDRSAPAALALARSQK